MKIISTIACQDHCCNLLLTKDEEYDQYFLEYFTSEFDNLQYRPSKKKFRMIWDILRGRQHRLFDILLSKDDIKRLLKDLQDNLEA